VHYDDTVCICVLSKILKQNEIILTVMCDTCIMTTQEMVYSHRQPRWWVNKIAPEIVRSQNMTYLLRCRYELEKQPTSLDHKRFHENLSPNVTWSWESATRMCDTVTNSV